MSKLVYNYTIKVIVDTLTYQVKATPIIHLEGAEHLTAAVADLFTRHHSVAGRVNAHGQQAVELWFETAEFDPKSKPSTAVAAATERAAIAVEKAIVEMAKIEKRIIEVMEIKEALEMAKEVMK